jgi:hypothetical protein
MTAAFTSKTLDNECRVFIQKYLLWFHVDSDASHKHSTDLADILTCLFKSHFMHSLTSQATAKYRYSWHGQFTVECLAGISCTVVIFRWDIYVVLLNSILDSTIYRVSQEECARFRENVSYVKVYRYNPKHLYPKLNGYGDNDQRSLKLWQLLHTYWLPNTY